MTPAAFRHAQPSGLAQALAALTAGHGGARVIAGGPRLVPAAHARLVRPDGIVDVNGMPGLDRIGAAPNGGLVLGALVRHADLIAARLVADRAPLLVEAARHVGHLAIRTRGTLGGSLAHADPAAELPAAALALDVSLVLVGPRGTRIVPAGDFFCGPYTTALRSDEILTEVSVPPDRVGWGFAEFGRRPGAFALAGVAATLRPAPDDPRRCAEARVVGFGLGPTPVRLRAAEAMLAGAALDGRAAARAGAAAAASCEPPGDARASAEYRRHLACVLTEGVVLQAIARLDFRR